MALTLYQESIPFTNKRIPQPISGNGAYSNPIVMSFAFDFTVCTNVLETVMYIRNDDANSYYRNVIITLCKDDPGTINPIAAYGIMKPSTTSLGNYIEIGGRYNVPLGFSMEQPPVIPTGGTYITGMYTTGTMPITDYIDDSGNQIGTDEHITARFSYGYDELSTVEWQNTKPCLVIPQIGNSTSPDTSYIPVRLRMNWKKASSLFTIRDYYIDISYEKIQTIGLEM